MKYAQLINSIANILKVFDSEKPIHKNFQPGIGPFGEPQIVAIIAKRLCDVGFPAITRRTPDLEIARDFAIEIKIARPFGDNGKEAENWTVNLLHPYPGNASLIGDAIKLSRLSGYLCKGLFVIGYEHSPAKISLDPLIESFETIMRSVIKLEIGDRIEERRDGLVHPEHQVLRCFGWELIGSA
jgi:hypothetical protein